MCDFCVEMCKINILNYFTYTDVSALGNYNQIDVILTFAILTL